MRRLLSSFGALLALSAWSLPSAASIELPERCHMGECWVTTLESKELLRSNELGDLYLATFSSVTYVARDSGEGFRQMFVNYHGSERVEGSSEGYIFCSSSMPSNLFVTQEKEYFLNRLAIAGTPPVGSYWMAHVQYLATCHNIAGPDFFSTSVANILIREGYNFGEYGFAVDQQMRVSNILEIMNPDAVGF